MIPDLTGNFGAAFLLRTPSTISFTAEHPEGIVTVRAGAPYITVVLSDTGRHDTEISTSWRVIQETLDVYTARRRRPLATRNGELEYLSWSRNGNGYNLTCVDTGESSWSMSSGTAGDNSAQTSFKIPYTTYHPALRFYRLSQQTDDLFDAYRNAYLALECLISSESDRRMGKNQESVLDWQTRVIKDFFSGANFSGIHIEKTLKVIYEEGRNPISHAKQNETFYVPYGDKRQNVQELFGQLTNLLVILLQYKLGHTSAIGWPSWSQEANDAAARASFQFDALILKNKKSTASTIPKILIFDEPRRFGHLWARIEASPPTSLTYFTELEAQLNGKPMFKINFHEQIPLAQIKALTVEINLIQYHERAPKSCHSA